MDTKVKNRNGVNEAGRDDKHSTLAALAHEIRNPLAAVVNGVHVLRQNGITGAIAEQTLDLIERQLNQVIRLMEMRLGSTPPTESREPTGSQSSPPSRPHMLRLLVVEDNQDVARSLASMLRLWGHDVQVVHDGAAAIKVAEELKPHLVLLDLNLPGLDGVAVAHRFRQHATLKDQRLAAVTASGKENLGSSAKELGFDHYLVKPVAPLVLKELLDSVN